MGLVALGLLTLAGATTGIVTAQAAAAPGSNFGNIAISVTATGLRSPFYSHSGEDAEGEAPYANATLLSGGVGHALTSVFWPGGTGGNGGSTLQLLAGGCVPPNPANTIPIPIPLPLPNPPCVTHTPTLPDPVYKAANDSYKAEVQSSSSQTTVKKSSPGVDMVATATDSRTSSSTTIAGGKLPGAGDTFGSSVASSTIHLTGPNTAVIDAVSQVRNLSLGGGALTMAAVSSVAHVITNGKTATGHAATTVTGMKVHGVPVTVDSQGIHIDGKGQALPSLDALNGMLKKAGFTVFVADPTKKIQGAHAQLFSGQLIVMQDNPQYTSNANDSAQILSFGGAGIDSDTSPAYTYIPPPLSQSSAAAGPATPTGRQLPPASGPPSSGGVGPAPQVAGSAPVAQSPLLAAAQFRLPGGIAAGWVVLALLGAGLIAVGLKRLPDRVLASTGGVCTLGNDA